MMPQAERYPFVSQHSALGTLGHLPFLPVTLTLRQRSIQAQGLLDTAAMVNVLPYDLGLQLGAAWDQQTTVVRLAGNLANEEARGLLLTVTVGKLRRFSWPSRGQEAIASRCFWGM